MSGRIPSDVPRIPLRVVHLFARNTRDERTRKGHDLFPNRLELSNLSLKSPQRLSVDSVNMPFYKRFCLHVIEHLVHSIILVTDLVLCLFLEKIRRVSRETR